MYKHAKEYFISKKNIILILFFLFFSFLLSFIIAEIILRIKPVPGIKIVCSRFDSAVGFILYPHTTMIYSNKKGDFVRKRVNSLGYLDVEHKKEKEKGVYRIGFFGDSYIEAIQVPTEDAFFRIIERGLRIYDVECLAFAYSGRGTLHSYLENKRKADDFDLDLIVYVFCENDFGDNIKEVKRNPYLPYAVLEGGSFKIDYSFREKYSFKENLYYKIYLYLKRKSLTIATLVTRIKLLIDHGVKTKVREDYRAMATKSEAGKIPREIDPPSTWPDSLRDYAKDLGFTIILKWMDETQNSFKKFAVLYVPEKSEMEKVTKDQDSWKPWLESFCTEKNIIFIDPTEDLIAMKSSGEEVFDDHFTVHGHKAFAKSFIDWFAQNRQNLE